jgi:multidrug efflux pump subunit AcrB
MIAIGLVVVVVFVFLRSGWRTAIPSVAVRCRCSVRSA